MELSHFYTYLCITLLCQRALLLASIRPEIRPLTTEELVYAIDRKLVCAINIYAAVQDDLKCNIALRAMDKALQKTRTLLIHAFNDITTLKEKVSEIDPTLRSHFIKFQQYTLEPLQSGFKSLLQQNFSIEERRNILFSSHLFWRKSLRACQPWDIDFYNLRTLIFNSKNGKRCAPELILFFTEQCCRKTERQAQKQYISRKYNYRSKQCRDAMLALAPTIRILQNTPAATPQNAIVYTQLFEQFSRIMQQFQKLPYKEEWSMVLDAAQQEALKRLYNRHKEVPELLTGTNKQNIRRPQWPIPLIKEPKRILPILENDRSSLKQKMKQDTITALSSCISHMHQDFQRLLSPEFNISREKLSIEFINENSSLFKTAHLICCAAIHWHSAREEREERIRQYNTEVPRIMKNIEQSVRELGDSIRRESFKKQLALCATLHNLRLQLLSNLQPSAVDNEVRIILNKKYPKIFTTAPTHLLNLTAANASAHASGEDKARDAEQVTAEHYLRALESYSIPIITNVLAHHPQISPGLRGLILKTYPEEIKPLWERYARHHMTSKTLSPYVAITHAVTATIAPYLGERTKKMLTSKVQNLNSTITNKTLQQADIQARLESYRFITFHRVYSWFLFKGFNYSTTYRKQEDEYNRCSTHLRSLTNQYNIYDQDLKDLQTIITIIRKKFKSGITLDAGVRETIQTSFTQLNEGRR